MHSHQQLHCPFAIKTRNHENVNLQLFAANYPTTGLPTMAAPGVLIKAAPLPPTTTYTRHRSWRSSEAKQLDHTTHSMYLH